MDTILIVDDDHHLRQGFARLLTEEGYAVESASSGEQALDMVRQRMPHCVIMDVRMSGMDGLAALRALRDLDERLPVIIMTAFSTTQTAIEATKLGAFDYVLKPFDVPEMLDMLRKAVDAGHSMRARVTLAPHSDQDDGEEALVGRSAPMQAIYKAIGRVAPTDALVLIRGESGTGKELVARALYQHSLRAHKPFSIINCVTIPDTLLESELFGYEKGAFTGAHTRRIGKIEQAGGGTVFLDEIGDIPLSLQAKLLRLLQEKHIERLGARDPIAVDVRILAATNADLENAVAEGRFREDLYYRLKVVTLDLPPLRDRRDDLPLLAQWFLTRHAKTLEVHSPGLDPAALRELAHYPWPGNVRELSNAIQKALVFNRGMPISAGDLRQALPSPAGTVDILTDGSMYEHIRTTLHSGGENLFEVLMDGMGRAIVREALHMTNGNRSHAARLLGMSRPTLLARMEKYGLKIETHIEG